MTGTRIAQRLRHRQLDGVTVLLDLGAGQYFLFDETATTIWNGFVAGEAPITIAERLVGDGEAPSPARIADVLADVQQFGNDCLQRGFLIAGDDIASPLPPSPAVRHAARAASSLRAWLALLRSWWHLRRHGFAGLHALAVEEAATPRRLGTNTPVSLRQAETAFLRAENFFILKSAPNDCLPRSTALFLFLHALGLPVQLQIGVERYPLNMHAWVECDGHALLDDPDAVRMTPLETVGRAK